MPFDIVVGRNESDKKLFGERGLVFIGKSFVTMGNYTSLSNPIFMDVARSHVVLIAGKRGSGKSYSIGAIAESISDLGKEEAGNIASLIFDTMGIFWTMKYKNVKDEELLSDWNLEAKNVQVKVFAPFGYFQEYRDKGIEVDAEFAIKISELDVGDWINLFELDFSEPVAVLIEKIVGDLKEGGSFGFGEIYSVIERSEKFSREVKNSAIALFDAAKAWRVFDEEKGTLIKDLVLAGRTSVIDLSMYASLGGFNVRALIIGLVSKRIFEERMRARKDEEIVAIQGGGVRGWELGIRREMPLVWIFIDEAHEFLPRDERTPATDALVQLLREGRQPGISLVLATQQPGKIHSDAITQSDIVISHRITAKPDVEALNEVTQSYLYGSIVEKMNGLPKLKGSAIILDDNSERIYPMRIRPRFTWHGGEAPTSISKSEIL